MDFSKKGTDKRKEMRTARVRRRRLVPGGDRRGVVLLLSTGGGGGGGVEFEDVSEISAIVAADADLRRTDAELAQIELDWNKIKE